MALLLNKENSIPIKVSVCFFFERFSVATMSVATKHKIVNCMQDGHLYRFSDIFIHVICIKVRKQGFEILSPGLCINNTTVTVFFTFSF